MKKEKHRYAVDYVITILVLLVLISILYYMSSKGLIINHPAHAYKVVSFVSLIPPQYYTLAASGNGTGITTSNVSLQLPHGYRTYFYIGIADNVTPQEVVNWTTIAQGTISHLVEIKQINYVHTFYWTITAGYGTQSTGTSDEEHGSQEVLGAETNVTVANGKTYSSIVNGGTSVSISFNATGNNSTAIIEYGGINDSSTTFHASLPSYCSPIVSGNESSIATAIEICRNMPSGSYSASLTANRTSAMAIAAYVFPVYAVKLNDLPSGGTISTDGRKNFNGSGIEVIGQGTINASAPSGYTFSKWLLSNSINASVSNLTNKNAYFSVDGNVILTAEYSLNSSTTSSTSTTTSTSTSTTSTSTSSTSTSTTASTTSTSTSTTTSTSTSTTSTSTSTTVSTVSTTSTSTSITSTSTSSTSTSTTASTTSTSTSITTSTSTSTTSTSTSTTVSTVSTTSTSTSTTSTSTTAPTTSTTTSTTVSTSTSTTSTTYVTTSDTTTSMSTTSTPTTAVAVSFPVPKSTSTTSTTVSTSSTSSSVTTTVPVIPQNETFAEVSVYPYAKHPAQIFFNNSRLVLEVESDANSPYELNVGIRNITAQIMPPDKHFEVSVINITYSNTSALSGVLATIGYPCYINSAIAPFYYSGGVWIGISNYSVNKQKCLISFSLPNDIIVGLMANSPVTTTTTVATTTTTTIPYVQVSYNERAVLYFALLAIALVVAAVLIVAYAFRKSHANRRDLKREAKKSRDK